MKTEIRFRLSQEDNENLVTIVDKIGGTKTGFIRDAIAEKCQRDNHEWANNSLNRGKYIRVASETSNQDVWDSKADDRMRKAEYRAGYRAGYRKQHEG